MKTYDRDGHKFEVPAFNSSVVDDIWTFTIEEGEFRNEKFFLEKSIGEDGEIIDLITYGYCSDDETSFARFRTLTENILLASVYDELDRLFA